MITLTPPSASLVFNILKLRHAPVEKWRNGSNNKVNIITGSYLQVTSRCVMMIYL